MIKMSRIIFTLRGAVMSYQNGFGGNDLAGREAAMGGGGGLGGRQDTTREGCVVCVYVHVCVSYLTIQIVPFLIFFLLSVLTIISLLKNHIHRSRHKVAVHDATSAFPPYA